MCVTKLLINPITRTKTRHFVTRTLLHVTILWMNTLNSSQSHISTDGQSVSLGVEPHLGLMTGYLLLFASYGLIFVGRRLWREDGSVFCICCWHLPGQYFSGSSPLGLATVFYSLRIQTSLFVASYDSQGHGGGIRPRLYTGLYWIHEWTLFYNFGGPNRSYWSPVSVVAETTGDPKTFRIHGNVCWTLVGMRISFSNPLPSERTFACSLLFRFSCGVYKMLPSKQWL
jgi:hypothetical protein